MDLKQRLREALTVTTREFKRALAQSFEPTTGVKAYPERMVSYYYIRAIAMALSPANVFLELPVTRGGKQDNHIDALVFNHDEVVAAEFKVGWAPSHWDALARDLKRLRGPIAKEIRNKFKGGPRRRPFIFLGSDCWNPEKAKVWTSGIQSGGWNLPKPMLAAHDRDYLRVYPDKGKGYDGYYFTWALFDFDEMFA
ncbi:MAG: hypothetical protein WA373_09255 [Burkholderiales bacterium]